MKMYEDVCGIFFCGVTTNLNYFGGIISLFCGLFKVKVENVNIFCGMPDIFCGKQQILGPSLRSKGD